MNAPVHYLNMTAEQMLEWGRAELVARTTDLKVRTEEGLKQAQANATVRRKAIGASASAAASMVSDAVRHKRIAAAGAATDAQRYVRAMIDSDHDTLVRIEQKHGLYGYPPEIVSIGLTAVAEGKDAHEAIDAYLAGAQQ